MEWEFNSYYTLNAATLVLLVGKFLVQKIKFLRDFNIPEPVAGGFIVPIVLVPPPLLAHVWPLLRDVARLRERIADHLNTTVEIISKANGRGKLVIHFSSNDAFSGLLERLRLDTVTQE